MNLHEYQSKQIFGRYGIPIPVGKVASTPTEAHTIAQEMGGRVVVKAQVLTGGRGKAGGIKIADSPSQAEELTKQILAMHIRDLPVRKVLLDPFSPIETEIYLGITNDRAARKPVMMASAAGGVDIEEVAAATPEKIIRAHVDPIMGLHSYQARELAAGIDLPREHWRVFEKICHALWHVYRESDATLAEINPLVITQDQQLIALDGKMSIDDNALYRHADLAEMRDLDVEDAAETEARKHGLSFIKLDGEIGCMVNGAGLAMTTMDIIKLFGGNPANFLDIGGGADSEQVAAALRIIVKDPNVKAILVNIFGGITRCDDVARGILDALEETQVKLPLIVRFGGTRAKEGLQLLAEADMITAETLTEAAHKAIKAAGEPS